MSVDTKSDDADLQREDAKPAADDKAKDAEEAKPTEAQEQAAKQRRDLIMQEALRTAKTTMGQLGTAGTGPGAAWPPAPVPLWA